MSYILNVKQLDVGKITFPKYTAAKVVGFIGNMVKETLKDRGKYFPMGQSFNEKYDLKYRIINDTQIRSMYLDLRIRELNNKSIVYIDLLEYHNNTTNNINSVDKLKQLLVEVSQRYTNNYTLNESIQYSNHIKALGIKEVTIYNSPKALGANSYNIFNHKNICIAQSKDWQSNNKLVMFIVFKNNFVRPIACITYDKSESFIRDISVDEDTRNIGVGTFFINYCLFHMKKLGHNKITLTVNANNTAAQRLYERIGFTQNKKRPMFSGYRTFEIETNTIQASDYKKCIGPMCKNLKSTMEKYELLMEN